MATSLVCGDDRFPVLSPAYAPLSPSAQVVMDPGSEDWFVELVELESPGAPGAEPLLMCQAYSLEYRATSVTNLKFERYELKIEKLQGGGGQGRSSIEHMPNEYRRPTAR